jgi:ABC-2 type transport system permease protein
VTPTVRTTQAVSAAIYFPAIFVSGVVFPTEALPELARRIGQILPFTYGVRAIREAWTLGTMDWTAFAVLAATVVIAVPTGLHLFRWETHY